MNKYELTIVLPGKVTSAKKKSVVEMVEKLIKVYKGSLGKVEDWGIKELAYKIMKNETGVFLHVPFEVEPSFVKQIDTKLKMNDDIIRYLIVTSNK